VRAGGFSAERLGTALTDVRWGSQPIASSIHVTVRDEGWGTLGQRIVQVDDVGSGSTAELRIASVFGGDRFLCRLAVRMGAGSVECEMEGEALEDFVARRIGVCVLHPWEAYVGARYTASGAGPATTGVFEEAIAPQPLVDGHYRALIPAFTRLEVTFPGSGVEATFSFEGEPRGFELEDQRNWTDASFKTYPTPLEASAPRTIRRGERCRQRLSLRVAGTPPADVEEDEGDRSAVTVTIGPVAAGTAPTVGLSAPTGPSDPERVRALDPGHLRLVLDGPGTARDVRPTVGDCGLPLEVALLVDDDEPDPLGRLDALRGLPVARLLILRRNGEAAGGAFVSGVRGAALDGLVVGGGTASHFSELNRSVPDPGGLDVLALAITPQVHDVDAVRMVETLEVQTQVVRQLSRRWDGVPVVVSPVTLAPHGPSGDGPIDERSLDPFGAAWTIGSAAALAEGGAASITFHEAMDRTVLRSAGLERAIGLLTARAGGRLRSVASSAPRRVRVIATELQDPVLVNLTADEQHVRVGGILETDRTLGAYEVLELGRSSR